MKWSCSVWSNLDHLPSWVEDGSTTGKLLHFTRHMPVLLLPLVTFHHSSLYYSSLKTRLFHKSFTIQKPTAPMTEFLLSAVVSSDLVQQLTSALPTPQYTLFHPFHNQPLWLVAALQAWNCQYPFGLHQTHWLPLKIIRDVTEPAKCGFHVQNPSDADLSCDQN